MTETSSSSTPPTSSTPASGAGSSGTPGTPGKDPATAPDLEAGRAVARATSADAPTTDTTIGDTTEDGGTAERDKNTIGNIRD